MTNVSIIPQDIPSSSLGVKSFLVLFSPLEGGTYSYAIGPGISDRFCTITSTGMVISGNEMDQNADGQPGELTLDQYATPRPLNGTAFQSPYDPTTLPIIIPGPSIISTAALDANGNPIPQQTDGENLALNTDVTGVQVTFDRDMRVGSFVPSDILSLVGPIGPVPGPFTVAAVSGSLRVFNIYFATATAQRCVHGDDQSEHLFGGQQRPEPGRPATRLTPTRPRPWFSSAAAARPTAPRPSPRRTTR